MEPSKPLSSPSFLQRSRSGTPRLCHVPPPPPCSKSAAKARSTSAISRPRPSPRQPAPEATKKARMGPAASAWALSPGRSPASPTEDRRRGGGVLGFFRKKKEPSTREESAHRLRLLSSRLLQWRLANARAESAMETARCAAERKLLITWLRVNEMRNIVAAKRIMFQRRKLKLKLSQIINPQIQYLVIQWEPLAKRHLDAVARLTRILGDMSLSIPLVDGAQGNIASIYNYFSIAMDIVKDIETTIGTFFSKVETVSFLLCEMANNMRLEMESVEELVKTSKIITSMEMHEMSLRANLFQAMKERIYINNSQL